MQLRFSRAGILIVMSCLASFIISCTISPTKGAENGDGSANSTKVYGYLYTENATPAANAHVFIVPSDNIPGNALSKTNSNISTDGLTDNNGKYSFSNIPAGTYNIFGENEESASMISSVAIVNTPKSTCIPNDTLKKKGQIKGVIRFSQGGDSRKILILVLGSNILPWTKNDSLGNFTITNLAHGSYLLRFLSTDSRYMVLDTTITVLPGKETDVGTITLRLSITSDSLKTWQELYVAQKFGMFIHFGMSTFARYQFPTPMDEWELGGEDENLFHPNSLNIGQWADVAKSAGCKYVVLTVKHFGGFCLWPSKSWSQNKPHSIVQSSWYGDHGNRDIVKEFVDSVRSRGLEPGLYYSIWDKTNTATIKMVKAQLTELLTNYGDIKVIWFDGWGWNVGYNQIPYDTIANLVHKINQNLNHHTIISENNHQFKLYNTDIVQYEIPLDGPPLQGNTLVSEAHEPLRVDMCWFWHPINSDIKNTQFILDRITNVNAVNATYLLNVTPDTSGLIPIDQVARMAEIGSLR